MKKENEQWSSHPPPRSILSSLHEPLVDPKDGHGARSNHDVMVLQMWAAARKGDDKVLIDLLRLILRQELEKLKAARNMREVRELDGPTRRQIRSLVPAMIALRMIRVETVQVPPDYNGFSSVTTRQKILFEDWFEEYALDSEERDPNVVRDVRDWIDGGALQRPSLGQDWND